MSTGLKDANLKSLIEQTAQLGKVLKRYQVLLFVVFVSGIYIFISYQIFILSAPPTDTSDVNSQVTNLTPHIDVKVVNQLESLKDNSVNVKTLFKSARDNPFAE